MLSTEELKKLLAPAPDSSQNIGSSHSCGFGLCPFNMQALARQPASPWEPHGALRKGKQAQPLHLGVGLVVLYNNQSPRNHGKFRTFCPPLPASSSSRLPLRSEPRRNLQESTAFASKQARCSLVAQPTRKDLCFSACHPPNYSLCLESNNNRASFMSSSHHEPWSLMRTAKHWEVLKGQGGCAASSPRPLGENPSHSPVQNPAPEKLPEAPSASRAHFLGLAWVTVGGAPRRASRSESSCTQVTKGKKGWGTGD